MGDEKRSEVRLLCADMVEIQWKDPSGQGRRMMGLLEDISRSGACVQLEAPVTPGVELNLTCHRRRLTGVVRYCVYREIGYFVGVEFEMDSQWSPRDFRPQHLLDLRQLTTVAR